MRRYIKISLIEFHLSHQSEISREIPAWQNQPGKKGYRVKEGLVRVEVSDEGSRSII